MTQLHERPGGEDVIAKSVPERKGLLEGLHRSAEKEPTLDAFGEGPCLNLKEDTDVLGDSGKLFVVIEALIWPRKCTWVIYVERF